MRRPQRSLSLLSHNSSSNNNQLAQQQALVRALVPELVHSILWLVQVPVLEPVLLQRSKLEQAQVRDNTLVLALEQVLGSTLLRVLVLVQAQLLRSIFAGI